MAWWGKVLGGTLGFIIGGPLGALLGAAFGHNIDARSAGGKRGSGFLPGGQERTQAAFFTATFSVMGHVAKADGRVSAIEIALVEQLMSHKRLTPEQRKLAIRLFDQGKSDAFQLAPVLAQFKQECHARTTLVRAFMEVQVQAAYADGKLDPAESRVLQQIADALGFSPAALEQIINLIKGAGASQGGQQISLEEAYKILGVSEDMTTDEIRKAYRRLLSQHHPDKLVSKGLPEEMIKLANEKTHEIRSAWKVIQKSRGGV